MSWLPISILAPVLWAISTHIDKYLVERYFKTSDVGALLIFTACVSAAFVPLVWLFNREVINVDPESAILLIVAGALYMGAMLFYLRALQQEDASVVAVFFQAGPLFGYVLAYFVLGERLSLVQMGGGFLMVGGVVIASIRSDALGQRIKSRIVVLMLTCSLAIAVSGLLFKLVAIRDAFWPSTFWMYAGEAMFGLFLLMLPSARHQFLQLIGANPTFVISINAFNELINLIGALATRFALTLAPLSLVQAIGGTTTLFVFLIAILLSAFFPGIEREKLERREIIQKGFASVLVAAGLALVSF